jgi:ubiquinone/menaquinone biosynthesis C-methylase UbiE
MAFTLVKEDRLYLVLEKLVIQRRGSCLAVRRATSRQEQTRGDEHVRPFIRQDLLKDLDHPRKILDIGAGPMTVLGKKMNGMPLDITAVDALADKYSNLNFPNGLPLIKTQQCESERLTSMFQANTFYLTYAQNTLDHSYDPIVAIREMIAVTKPGGIIATAHAANEAIKENWEGFHQWNFHVDGRDFKVSNRTSTFSVSQAIEGLAKIVDLSPDHADYVGCVMRKL